MKMEWPECKRCCFCMPLRRGLLTWGYIKLLMLLILTVYSGYVMLFMILIYTGFGVGLFCFEVIVGIAIMLMLFSDTAFTIVLLVGGHRKLPDLLQIYYKFSIVITCVAGLLWTGFFTLTILDKMKRNKTFTNITFTVYADVLMVFLFIAIQGYVILLVRSEMNKLINNNANFRFVNNAADAKCSMEDDGISDVTHVICSLPAHSGSSIYNERDDDIV